MRPNGDFNLFEVLCSAECASAVVREYRFCPSRRWRFDFALPEHRVAVEVEGGVWIGGRHTSPAGFLKDIEKYNTAAAMGWRVLRCVPSQLCNGDFIALIKQTINTKQHE